MLETDSIKVQAVISHGRAAHDQDRLDSLFQRRKHIVDTLKRLAALCLVFSAFFLSVNALVLSALALCWGNSLCLRIDSSHR